MHTPTAVKCLLVIADSTADKAYNAPTSPAMKPEINTA
jgi:hypothetical protein